MTRAARELTENECRRCSTFCDRVIRPASCVQAGCTFLFHYDDPLSGRRYMGCLQRVFASEIDVEMLGACRAHADRLRSRQAHGRAQRSHPGVTVLFHRLNPGRSCA